MQPNDEQPAPPKAIESEPSTIRRTPKLLNLAETETLIGATRSSIYRWIDRGTFPKPRHSNGAGTFTRWHIDDLNAWIDGKRDWS